MSTMSAREFNRDVSPAKRAADQDKTEHCHFEPRSRGSKCGNPRKPSVAAIFLVLRK